MIDSINQFSKKGSSVDVKLSVNHFSDEASYIGKITRRTIGLNDLIGGIIKKNVGIDANIIQSAAALLQLEILENLASGNAVNILNLGVLYAATDGSVKNTSEKPKLRARFTTSKLSNKAASKLSIENMAVSDSKPFIMSVTDFYEATPENGVITKRMMAEVIGERLKVSGDGSGIFFAPVKEDGEIEKDEKTWTKVEEARVKKNLPKSLLFYVPESLSTDMKYQIVVRTALSGSKIRKAVLSGYSEAISVKEAASC